MPTKEIDDDLSRSIKRQDSGFSDITDRVRNDSEIQLSDDNSDFPKNYTKNGIDTHTRTTFQLSKWFNYICMFIFVLWNVSIQSEVKELRNSHAHLMTKNAHMQAQLQEMQDVLQLHNIPEPEKYRVPIFKSIYVGRDPVGREPVGKDPERRVPVVAAAAAAANLVPTAAAPPHLLQKREASLGKRMQALVENKINLVLVTPHSLQKREGKREKKRKKKTRGNKKNRNKGMKRHRALVDDLIKEALEVKYDHFIGNLWGTFDYDVVKHSNDLGHKAKNLPGEPTVYESGHIYYSKTETPISVFRAPDNNENSNLVKYDPATGTFLVETPGVFLIHLNITLVDKKKISYAAIFLNDQAMMACQRGGFRCPRYNDSPEDDTYRICNIDGMLHLRKGDKVEARTMEPNMTVRLERHRKAYFKFLLLHKSEQHV